jgi:16S rRNA (adenine1518-N6/adenine1519-N6)-dimethyltransferase
MTTVRRLRDSGGFKAQKSLGQHFLVDRAVIAAIIEGARPSHSDLVVEIGPGLGALTFPLARAVNHVVAVEKDLRAVAELERKLRAEAVGNVTLIRADILDFPLEVVAKKFSQKVNVIGNLPYNISKPVLEMLVRSRNTVERAVLMFQAEVADRLLASPGSKAYGALTLMVRYRACPRLMLNVSRDAFRPKPKVASKVVSLDFSSPYRGEGEGEDWFDAVVRAAFSHRRKTLINSLMGSGHKWSKDILTRALDDCGIEASRRAETLSIDEFLTLSAYLRD